MADEVAVPQICLVIELAQPRKEEDGSITPAEIETIRANLPARYFDIRIVTPEDQTDEDGVYTGSTTKYTESNDPHEFRAKYPFTVFSPHEYVQREPGRDSEWVIAYGEGDDYAECLVLGTRDLVEALARFREEHATVPIWSATRAELDQGDDHPMGYLDRYDEILVVGGAKLRKGPGRSTKTTPS